MYGRARILVSGKRKQGRKYGLGVCGFSSNSFERETAVISAGERAERGGRGRGENTRVPLSFCHWARACEDAVKAREKTKTSARLRCFWNNPSS